VVEIVSTGLNLERRKKRSGSRLEVTCNGDPKAALVTKCR
jgi:hypothetical protein